VGVDTGGTTTMLPRHRVREITSYLMHQGSRGRHAYGSLVVGGAVVFCRGMRTMFTYRVIFVRWAVLSRIIII